VYEVKGKTRDGQKGRFVLKMIPVTDINDATAAQREAKDLR
jgi:hypothetical protein